MKTAAPPAAGPPEPGEVITVSVFFRPEADVKQELDFDQSDLFILPPPDLYADLTVE